MLPRAALALTLVALVASVASAAPAARNGQLLYLRPLGGNAPPYGRLFLAAPSGEGARDITPAGILDVQGAAWSPDGRRIAISAIAEADHDPEIFVVAADGTRLRPRRTITFRTGNPPGRRTDGGLPSRVPAPGSSRSTRCAGTAAASAGSRTRQRTARLLPGHQTGAGSCSRASSATGSSCACARTARASATWVSANRELAHLDTRRADRVLSRCEVGTRARHL
jgi:hypothetical protein